MTFPREWDKEGVSISGDVWMMMPRITILVLALVHHIRISANIPMALFLDWLRSFNCDIVIEFVDRHDEMVVKLLQNKTEQYLDYNRVAFEHELQKRFKVRTSKDLKGGKRVIYHIEPQ